MSEARRIAKPLSKQAGEDPVEFREVKSPAELETLLALIQEIWPEVFVPIIGREQVDYMLVHYQGKDAIAAGMEQGIRYFLIEHEDGYIGYFAYSLESGRLFISKVYLKKAYRGRGLSSPVFRHLEELALKNNRKKLFLHVNRFNKNAVAVYLHRGFEIVKTVDEPLGEKFFLNDYWMEKNLCPRHGDTALCE